MDSTALLSNGITTQSVDKANQCSIKNTVNEDIDSCEYFQGLLER
jgi:hypothetical protein